MHVLPQGPGLTVAIALPPRAGGHALSCLHRPRRFLRELGQCWQTIPLLRFVSSRAEPPHYAPGVGGIVFGREDPVERRGPVHGKIRHADRKQRGLAGQPQLTAPYAPAEPAARHPDSPPEDLAAPWSALSST